MENFWEKKSLQELNTDEWEALCDGCGLCCVHRLANDEGEIFTTNVVCRYYDLECGGCLEYKRRSELVASCVHLDTTMAKEFSWLPETCAYRLVALGLPLPSWHYLVCGDKSIARSYGVAKDDFIKEYEGIVLEEYIVDE